MKTYRVYIEADVDLEDGEQINYDKITWALVGFGLYDFDFNDVEVKTKD